MHLAHTLGAGGPDLELLILAGAMLVLGIVFFFQKAVKPMVPVVLVVTSLALSAGAFALSGDEPPSEPVSIAATIAISSPQDGDEVTAGEPLQLTVDLQGGTLSSDENADDPDVGHLHIFVDGALDSMPSSDTPEVVLEPGEHELVVEFTQANHSSFKPRILDRITVTAR